MPSSPKLKCVFSVNYEIHVKKANKKTNKKKQTILGDLKQFEFSFLLNQ